MKIRIEIMPKDDVLDPQGEAVGKALRKMQLGHVERVRVGKTIDIDLASDISQESALANAKQMAEKLRCLKPKSERGWVI